MQTLSVAFYLCEWLRLMLDHVWWKSHAHVAAHPVTSLLSITRLLGTFAMSCLMSKLEYAQAPRLIRHLLMS